MKHNIKIINYSYDDDYGTTIEINGKKLFYDGENTYNCLGEILDTLEVDYDLEIEQREVEKRFITKKMKLIEE